jgi:hypothetical protein
MQSIFACRSVYLSRFASSYKMLRAVVTLIACTWSRSASSGAILQRQQLGDEAGATPSVQACFLCNYGRLGRMIASRRSITLGTIALVGSSCRYGWSRSVPPRASFSASTSVMMWSQNAERF